MFVPTEALLVVLTAHGSLVATHHFINSPSLILHGTLNVAFEPCHEKTNILRMRKRRRRSAPLFALHG